MAGSWPWSVSWHRGRVRSMLLVFVVAAVALELAAGTGLSYIAGFSEVRAALGRVDWTWIGTLCGALGVSFVGYYYAYRGIFTVAGGVTLPRRRLLTVATVGFGGFLAHAGGKLDRYALEASGAPEEAARIRVLALAGLEYGVLAIGGCATAITVLVTGSGIPPDFTLPWAVAPVPGFGIAFWAAQRYRGRFRCSRSGWRGAIGTFLEAVCLIRELFARPLRWGWGWLGMAVFWAGDGFAVWAGLAAFGYRMDSAALFVGYATGMVFTRRSGPLAGAGVLAVVLPVALNYCGAPLAVAIAGVFAYRVLAFWLPMPASLAALPALRRMGRRLSHSTERPRPPSRAS
ncbi:MAG: hypothetical protein J2P26_06125 [Nocardiopsaceae bacterium]|nr:hypothetical protein [Nocardiopsaceae bacterium]